MNRKILCILAVLMFIVLIFSFTACFNTSETQKSQDDENTGDDSGDTSDDDEEIYCTVTLVDNMSDKPTNLIEIKKGNKLSEISLKDSEDYFFVGWYTDEHFTQPYDFAAPVESDFTLYAKWLKKQDVELLTNNTLYLCKDGTADLSDVLPGSGYVAYGNMATITGSLITLSGVGRFTLRYTPSGSTGTTDVTVNVINGQNAGDWSELVSAINAGKNVALYRDITAPVGADTVAITNSVIYGNAKEIVVNNIVKGDIDNRGKNAFDVSGNGKAYFYDTIISGYKSEESEISDLTQFDGYGQLINVVNNDNNLRPDVLVKHCILQNGQKMMYVKGANVVVEGSVFRNGSVAGAGVDHLAQVPGESYLLCHLPALLLRVVDQLRRAAAAVQALDIHQPAALLLQDPRAAAERAILKLNIMYLFHGRSSACGINHRLLLYRPAAALSMTGNPPPLPQSKVSAG